jgi:hypothetical protein
VFCAATPVFWMLSNITRAWLNGSRAVLERQATA